MKPEDRRHYLENACDLFNAGEFWLAHEALETVWRSIIKENEAQAFQGLIQAAAAALAKLAGPQLPEVELETVHFRTQLARALAGEGDPPRLEFRTDA